VQRVGNCEIYLHARTGDVFAVLVELWGTIPELVRLYILKKANENGVKACDFVPIVKRRDTTSRPVQFYILNEWSNANAEWIRRGFAQPVEKLVTTYEHAPQSTLRLLRSVAEESQCGELVRAEYVGKRGTTLEPAQIQISCAENFQFHAMQQAHLK
jgi:hypothetical protein